MLRFYMFGILGMIFLNGCSSSSGLRSNQTDSQPSPDTYERDSGSQDAFISSAQDCGDGHLCCAEMTTILRNEITRKCQLRGCGGLAVDVDQLGQVTLSTSQNNLRGETPEYMSCAADVLAERDWPCAAGTSKIIFIDSCTLV
jgi:hypothetical protein